MRRAADFAMCFWKASRIGESTVCCERPFQMRMLSGKKEFCYTDDLANGTRYLVLWPRTCFVGIGRCMWMATWACTMRYVIMHLASALRSHRTGHCSWHIIGWHYSFSCSHSWRTTQRVAGPSLSSLRCLSCEGPIYIRRIQPVVQRGICRPYLCFLWGTFVGFFEERLCLQKGFKMTDK